MTKATIKALLVSDLHLELVQYPDGYEVDLPAVDVIIAAGDIWRAEIERAFAFLQHLAKGTPVVATLGNHCHAGGEVFETNRAAKDLAHSYGIHLLQDSSISIRGVTFVGSTLWTDGRLAGDELLANALVGLDIRVKTQIGEQPLTFGAMAQIHAHSLAFIEKTVEQASGPVVVVTHYAPHRVCLLPDHRSGRAAASAASDLSHLTDSGKIALWAHGHVHQSIDLVRPNGTRIVCNPAGRNFENEGFRDDFTVDIDVGE